MTIIASVSSLVLLTLAATVPFSKCPPRWSHPIATGFAGIVLLNILVHIYATNTPRETTNLSLLIIGCGLVLLSTPWLAIILAASLMGWAVVTWRLVGSSFHQYIDFGIISSLVIAVIVHIGRVRTAKHLHELRLRDQARAAELQSALESADRELAQRRRIETALQRTHAELDRRVRERTEELAKANDDLRSEMAERQKAEAQLRHAQKMDAIGQLAAGIAHDFNNMLTVIQGHASRLAASPPDSKELLREIIEASDRAGALTQQLLVFSRKQMLKRQVLDLNDVARNLSRMLARILGEHIELELQLSPGRSGIEADQGMIEQVLLNLAINARDAMPNGGRVVIHTRTARFDGTTAQPGGEQRAGSFVRLTISDTGTGIAAAHLPRIFEPFFTTKPIGKGTGLGLSTVYAIVQQHSGWIEVSSELNRGTQFHIFFPEVAMPSDSSTNSRRAQTFPRGTECILLAEDEPMVRQLAVRFLSHSGYRVLEAESGVAALDLWANHANDIDLLLTDLVMPGGISGRELAQRCLATKPSLKVIYTSGYSADFDELEPSLRRGHQFLPKPYRLDTLSKLLRECLDEKPRE